MKQELGVGGILGYVLPIKTGKLTELGTEERVRHTLPEEIGVGAKVGAG